MEPFVHTHTGKKFHFLNPHPDEICIEDIAHSLSLKCRFNGHTSSFYSVAQHCIQMSYWEKVHQKWLLFHDAAEAYIGDISTPVKQQFPEIWKIEDQILHVLAKKYNLTIPIPYDWIQKVDQRMLATEKRDILLHNFKWAFELPEPYEHAIIPVKSRMIEKMFFNRVKELGMGYLT